MVSAHFSLAIIDHLINCFTISRNKDKQALVVELFIC